MLSLENVSVSYGAIEALCGISMHVEKGRGVVTLIGANGAGKTTTLRTITSLLQPREGRVVFEGEEISGVNHTHKLRGARDFYVTRRAWVFANLTSAREPANGRYLKTSKREIAEDMDRACRCFRSSKARVRRRREHFPAVSSRCWQWVCA